MHAGCKAKRASHRQQQKGAFSYYYTGSICHYRHSLEMLPTLSEYIYASQHASCIKIPKLTSNTFFDTGQHVCKPCHKDCCVCLFKINIILAFDSRGSLKTKKYVPRQRKRLLSQNLVLIVGSLQNQIYLSMSLQCTRQLSLCKMGNWGLKPDSHHSLHFLAVELFQTEIFGDCQLLRFTFDLYLGTS